MTLLDEITNALGMQWYIQDSGGAAIHLAIVAEPFLTYILDGQKTIESRFSLNRIAPWRQVQAGDRILMKRPAGPVVGVFVVARAEYVELTAETWPQVRALAAAICVGEQFWAFKARARYATLLHVGEVRRFPEFWISKTDRRPWVVLRGAERAAEPDPVQAKLLSGEGEPAA